MACSSSSPRVGGGGLGKTGEEAFAFARALASDLDAGFDCAVVGADAEAAATEAAERGADRVLVVQGDRFANGGDELVAASVEAARIVDPALVVIPRGSEVLELTPRLAARLGGGSVTSVTGVRRGDGDTIEAVAAVFGGAGPRRLPLRRRRTGGRRPRTRARRPTSARSGPHG